MYLSFERKFLSVTDSMLFLNQRKREKMNVTADIGTTCI